MSHVSFFLQLSVCDCACDLGIKVSTITEVGDITGVLPLSVRTLRLETSVVNSARSVPSLDASPPVMTVVPSGAGAST